MTCITAEPIYLRARVLPPSASRCLRRGFRATSAVRGGRRQHGTAPGAATVAFTSNIPGRFLPGERGTVLSTGNPLSPDVQMTGSSLSSGLLSRLISSQGLSGLTVSGFHQLSHWLILVFCIGNYHLILNMYVLVLIISSSPSITQYLQRKRGDWESLKNRATQYTHDASVSAGRGVGTPTGLAERVWFVGAAAMQATCGTEAEWSTAGNKYSEGKTVKDL